MSQGDDPDIAKPLLKWFHKHKRVLPWRATPRDPYRVWIAEIMLQQTQVATVIPYFEKWMQDFPTVAHLANASLDDVLKRWEGLGYYARARNAHKAAGVIHHELRDMLPNTTAGLMTLPGIGPYTAAAVASLAFDRDAAALDGNIKRVMTRLAGLKAPNTKLLQDLCTAALPSGKAGAFNEALMDLGATICTLKAPNCGKCPIRTQCKAYATGHPETYAGAKQRMARPRRGVVTLVLQSPSTRMLMIQRPARGLLGGLWQFPGVDAQSTDSSSGESLNRICAMVQAETSVPVLPDSLHYVGKITHAFTHFIQTRFVYVGSIVGDLPCAPEARWANEREIATIALTRSDSRILELLRTSLPSNRTMVE